MSPIPEENVSYGYNLRDLQRECAVQLGMSPSLTLHSATRLYELQAISYHRTDFRFVSDRFHADGEQTLAMLASSSPIWERDVEKADPHYQSSVWLDEAQVGDFNAITPLWTADVGWLKPDEERVFNIIAQRYIALFDPSRSTRRGTATQEEKFEYRRFALRSHTKEAEFFGKSIAINGPRYYIDNRSGNIVVSIHDGVTGYAWLEIPIAHFSEVIESQPFASTREFIDRNEELLELFVEEASDLVLAAGNGLFVTSPNVFSVENGVRKYLWPMTEQS